MKWTGWAALFLLLTALGAFAIAGDWQRVLWVAAGGAVGYSSAWLGGLWSRKKER